MSGLGRGFYQNQAAAATREDQGPPRETLWSPTVLTRVTNGTRYAILCLDRRPDSEASNLRKEPILPENTIPPSAQPDAEEDVEDSVPFGESGRPVGRRA
jgi:hypothetical protein